ncbi:hypothetical protein QBC35DRAFT_496393 [Podospora australis]|uniref:Uncharacterized protein n=1 Tax=Podospora australis TaxID=1536484 RepID=A0AAN6WUJ1_9PEZI|nr:hypothetical protein QBC35DRAFT_496393 [Podospora australis]
MEKPTWGWWTGGPNGRHPSPELCQAFSAARKECMSRPFPSNLTVDHVPDSLPPWEVPKALRYRLATGWREYFYAAQGVKGVDPKPPTQTSKEPRQQENTQKQHPQTQPRQVQQSQMSQPQIHQPQSQTAWPTTIGSQTIDPGCLQTKNSRDNRCFYRRTIQSCLTTISVLWLALTPAMTTSATSSVEIQILTRSLALSPSQIYRQNLLVVMDMEGL